MGKIINLSDYKENKKNKNYTIEEFDKYSYKLYEYINMLNHMITETKHSNSALIVSGSFKNDVYEKYKELLVSVAKAKNSPSNKSIDDVFADAMSGLDELTLKMKTQEEIEKYKF